MYGKCTGRQLSVFYRKIYGIFLQCVSSYLSLFALFWKGVYSKRTKFASGVEEGRGWDGVGGANSFLLEKIPYRKDIGEILLTF